MKAELVATSKSKTQRERIPRLAEQSQVAFSKRKVSQQPHKPTADDFNGFLQVRSPIKAKMT